MFSTFGGARKREPLFTFKRKIPFIVEEPFLRKPLEETDNLNYNDLLIPTLEEIDSIDSNKKKPSPIVPARDSIEPSAAVIVKANRSCNRNNKRSAQRMPEPATDLEEIENLVKDPIFDFPDVTEEFSEIKVMVASSRPVAETVKATKKKPKSRNQSPAKPPKATVKSRKSSSTPTTRATNTQKAAACQDSFDIFNFDPEPTFNRQHKHTPHIPRNNNPNTCRPSDSSYQVNTAFRRPNSLDNILHSNPVQQNRTHLPEKKRKRNLVAHLKSASGETENKPNHQGFDFLSDEEEYLAEQQQLPLSPLREIITNKDRSLSPELSYAERMELELQSLMKSEFGSDKKQEKQDEPNTRRPRYQPMNKMNVRVTF